MIIDKSYIQGRIGHLLHLLSKRIRTDAAIDQHNMRLYRRKQRFPAWLRRMVFHPLNPLYSIWKTYRSRAGQNNRPIMDWLDVDFATYCHENDAYRLDTACFANPDKASQIITHFIDNKLRTALGLAPVFPTTLSGNAGFADFQAKIRQQK